MAPSPDYTPTFVSGRDGDLLLKVRAAPGSREEGILGVRGDSLRVGVRARPERGKANAALVEVIARELDLPRSALQLERGAASRDKVFRLRGISGEELRRRLQARLAGGP